VLSESLGSISEFVSTPVVESCVSMFLEGFIFSQIIFIHLDITRLFTYGIDVKLIVGSDRVLLLIFLTEIKFTPLLFDACDVKTLFAKNTVKLTI
jgi:hypothetical protein